MGADMILACCEMPGDYKAAKPLLLKRIKELDKAKVEALISEHYILESLIEDMLDDFEDKVTEGDLWEVNNLRAKKEKEVVSKTLEEALDYLFDGRYNRDTAEMQIRGVWFSFSGGLSWGDDPTESFHYISLIDDSGITDNLQDALETQA